MALEILRRGMPHLMRSDPEWAAIFARQGIEVLRPALAAGASLEALILALSSQGPDQATGKKPKKAELGAKRAVAERPCIYTGKGMAKLVFEFLVLRWLESLGETRCEKRDIYDQFTDTDALEVGEFPAFSTRLALLKTEEGWIDWVDNRQNARITLTDDGRKWLKTLKATELKPAHRKYLARTISWSGLADNEG